MEAKDSNGALLAEGDSVTLIKDLKVKGSSLTLAKARYAGEKHSPHQQHQRG